MKFGKDCGNAVYLEVVEKTRIHTCRAQKNTHTHRHTHPKSKMRRLGCSVQSGEGLSSSEDAVRKPTNLRRVFIFLGDGHIPTYINLYFLYLLSTVTGKGERWKVSSKQKISQTPFLF